MAPTICAVTGTIRDNSGSPIQGAIVNGQNLRPYVHPTDGSMVMDFQVSTTTDVNGNWTLNLVETTTPALTIMITFTYSTGTNNPTTTHEYNIMVPNTSTVVFTTLIGAQL